MTNEEKAHQIAWEYTKHYDPNCCKQEWVEMGTREIAKWKDEQIIKKAMIWLSLNADVFGYFKKGKLEDMITNFQKAMKKE